MENNKSIKLPSIGMRIIKSAFAVALCILVDKLRGDGGIVFYSQLAALWCIQMYRNNTMKNAIQRVIGTGVGALYGLIYLLLFPMIVAAAGDGVGIKIICAFASIVLVLYSTVLIRAKQASYFSCVVFLSIVVNHINDANPYLFVWNRVLDTLIGIAIGVVVNNIRICLHPDRETLFVSGVDDILVDKADKISAYSKVELNRMIDDGMKFTISTMRTPASLIEPLLDVRLNYPVIVMDGAALYDMKTNEYIRTYVISSDTAKEIYALTDSFDLNVYVNAIIDDTLLIFYKDSNDEINNQMVEKLKTSPYRNYINRRYDGNENVIYFMLLDKSEKLQGFYDVFVSKDYDKKLKILLYPSERYPGYSYIKIYNKNATKDNMMSYLMDKYGIKKNITFGTIEGRYDVIVHENSMNEMVKDVRKMYEPLFGIRKNKN